MVGLAVLHPETVADTTGGTQEAQEASTPNVPQTPLGDDGVVDVSTRED